MTISRLSSSRLTQGLPKFQSAWDQDNVAQGAMVPIASVTTTTVDPDVFFTNIPQTFQDLFLCVNARSSQTATLGGFFGGFNYNYGGNTNYSTTTLLGNGSAVSSVRQTSQAGWWGDGYLPALSSTEGVFGLMHMHILDYKNTSGFKTFIMRTAADTNGSGNTSLTAGLWRQTSAISTIYSTASIGMRPGSTLTLYGIKAGA
jgi:hypothetical protein